MTDKKAFLKVLMDGNEDIKKFREMLCEIEMEDEFFKIAVLRSEQGFGDAYLNLITEKILEDKKNIDENKNKIIQLAIANEAFAALSVLARHFGEEPVLAEILKQREKIQHIYLYDKKIQTDRMIKVMKNLAHHSSYEIQQKLEKTIEVFQQMYDRKMLGHSLGLSANFQCKLEDEILEESYTTFSAEQTSPALSLKFNNFYKTIIENLNQSDPNYSALTEIKKSFETLEEAIQKNNYTHQAKRFMMNKPIIFPALFPRHNAYAVLYKNKLYIVNKGAGNFFSSIEKYEVNDKKLPKTEKEMALLIQNLSEKKRPSISPLRKNNNIDLEDLKSIEPRLIDRHYLKGQKQGNCSYTNLKRSAHAILMALSEDEHSIFYNQLPVESIYKAFSNYEKQEVVKEYIQHYKEKNDPYKWDPLIIYLKTKTDPYNKRTIETAQLIIETLKKTDGSVTDEWIKNRMKEIPLQEKKRAIVQEIENSVASVYRFLEAAVFQKENRAEHLKRAFFQLLPGGKSYLHTTALAQAGLDAQYLPNSVLFKCFPGEVKPISKYTDFSVEKPSSPPPTVQYDTNNTAENKGKKSKKHVLNTKEITTDQKKRSPGSKNFS